MTKTNSLKTKKVGKKIKRKRRLRSSGKGLIKEKGNLERTMKRKSRPGTSGKDLSSTSDGKTDLYLLKGWVSPHSSSIKDLQQMKLRVEETTYDNPILLGHTRRGSSQL